MNFWEKAGRGEMLANAPVPETKVQKQLLADEFNEWLNSGFESENGEPPGLARYRKARLENICARIRAKKALIEALLKERDEHA